MNRKKEILELQKRVRDLEDKNNLLESTLRYETTISVESIRSAYNGDFNTKYYSTSLFSIKDALNHLFSHLKISLSAAEMVPEKLVLVDNNVSTKIKS